MKEFSSWALPPLSLCTSMVTICLIIPLIRVNEIQNSMANTKTNTVAALLHCHFPIDLKYWRLVGTEFMLLWIGNRRNLRTFSLIDFIRRNYSHSGPFSLFWRIFNGDYASMFIYYLKSDNLIWITVNCHEMKFGWYKFSKGYNQLSKIKLWIAEAEAPRTYYYGSFVNIYCQHSQTEPQFLSPATILRQGNVFTPVCNPVHGGGLCPSMHHRSHDQGRSLCRETSVQGDLCAGGLCAGGSLCRGSLWSGGLCAGGSLSWGGHLSTGGSLSSGGSLSRGVSVMKTPLDRDPPTVTSGRYTSYWNAFYSEVFSFS